MRSKYIWFLGALMIGCGNAQNIDISGTWYLQELSDGALQKDVRASENTPFVQFEEGKSINGNAGCNQFFASYSLKGNNINIKGAGLTRMLCSNESMAIEDSLMNIIRDGVSQIYVNGDKLIMQNAQTKAVFHR